jgi:hypothetical protein
MEIIFGGISMPDAKDFDGFYILPHKDDDGLRLSYFDFNDDFEKGKKIDHTSLGDMYHVVFLKQGEDGNPEFDDHFEAIFADPEVYVKGLLGANVYGCMVRKTENSWKWVEEYLKKLLGRVMINKMKNYAGSIAEN